MPGSDMDLDATFALVGGRAQLPHFEVTQHVEYVFNASGLHAHTRTHRIIRIARFHA